MPAIPGVRTRVDHAANGHGGVRSARDTIVLRIVGTVVLRKLGVQEARKRTSPRTGDNRDILADRRNHSCRRPMRKGNRKAGTAIDTGTFSGPGFFGQHTV